MIGLGTVVNSAAIVAGGVAGTFIKKGLPERFKNIIIQAISLAIIIIGIAGALQGIYRVVDGKKLDSQYIMLMIFSLVIGGIIGELIGIEDKLERTGRWFQNRFAKKEGTFAEGFITASLIYCVGSMAIVGSLEDGLSGNTGILFSKSVLDGVSAIVFASSLGIGVAFAALPILIYQGAITLLAGLAKPLLTEIVVTQVTLVGSVLIMCIGLNMLQITKIKIGNLLPAIFIPLVYYLLVSKLL
jgi:uncharacterized protein